MARFLDDLLRAPIFYSKVGQIVTAQLSFRRLIDLIGALGKEKLGNQTALRELEDLLREAKKAEQDRNTVMHSTWVADFDDPQNLLHHMKITARGRLNMRHEEVSVDSIYEIAQVIDLIRMKVSVFSYRRRYRCSLIVCCTSKENEEPREFSKLHCGSFA